jgi:hypothetical protein
MTSRSTVFTRILADRGRLVLAIALVGAALLAALAGIRAPTVSGTHWGASHQGLLVADVSPDGGTDHGGGS